jgi:threonine synthase
MDILISSNLERLLFELTGHDGEQVLEWMNKLKTEGKYIVYGEVKRKLSEMYWAAYTTEHETLETIRDVYGDYEYLIDTHTAVGVDVYDKYVISTGDMTKTVIVSTASPFKFNESVAKAIFGEEAVAGKNEFDLLGLLAEQCGLDIPAGLDGLSGRAVLHDKVCDRDQMKDQVIKILGLK